MINNTFIQSPKYQDYLDEKEDISLESVIFVEEEGKEKLIEHDKEFDFVPSGGEEGLALTRGKEGLEWTSVYTKEETDSLFEESNTNGYDYVDMEEAGIWASCNVGTNEIGAVGDYFAWGDTKGYTKEQINNGEHTFSWSNYKHCNGTIASLTKYCDVASYGTVDNKEILEEEDDAAHAIMGGAWRMPTPDDFDKLLDLCNIDLEYVKSSGNYCFTFTLKTNPNKKLYFPVYKSTGGDPAFTYYYYWTNKKGGTPWLALTYRLYMSRPTNDCTFSLYPNDRYEGLQIKAILNAPPKSQKYLTRKEAEESYQRIGDYVTADKDGILSKEDYTKLTKNQAILGINVYQTSPSSAGPMMQFTSSSPLGSTTSKSAQLPVASATSAGVMTTTMYNKLNTNANWEAQEYETGYIENKPFGEFDKELIYKNNNLQGGSISLDVDYAEKFIVGDSYTIVLNGQVFSNIIASTFNGSNGSDTWFGFFISNGKLSDSPAGAPTKGDFSIYGYYDRSCTLYIKSPLTTNSVYIYHNITPVIKKIDSKFIDGTIIREGVDGPIIPELIIDDLGRDESLVTKEIADSLYQPIGNYATKDEVVNADWDASEGEKGYIENKPFGEKDIFNRTLNITNHGNPAWRIITLENPGFSLDGNNKYKVKIKTSSFEYNDYVVGVEYLGRYYFYEGNESFSPPLTGSFTFWISEGSGGSADTLYVYFDAKKVPDDTCKLVIQESIPIDSKYLPIEQTLGNEENKIVSLKAITEGINKLMETLSNDFNTTLNGFQKKLTAGKGIEITSTNTINCTLDAYSKSEVDSAIANAKSELLGGAGEDYDTLKEIETWVTEHLDLYEALIATVADKASKEDLEWAEY